ncbi:MAG: FAD-binding oxidoreductase, partial [Gemmatimonadota bacterium]|nr:FAD-binding oxidoreductase [Gemmatimonadota bacterium]
MRPPSFRGTFRNDLPARAMYAEGAGIARCVPAAVAVPCDGEDVRALVRWARETGTALVPRGSGSGMAAGSVGPGVIVDLSRLDSTSGVERVGVGSHAAGSVRTGPGAIHAEVDRRAREAGLRFPVDPASAAFCTVGGMAATNAAGARTLLFGATRSWVSALDCVFADGARATIRRGEPMPLGVPAVARFVAQVPPLLAAGAAALEHAGVRKESSGYGLAHYARSGELVDLLVGSEGTLAIFVGVELALAPLPGATSSVLAAFLTLEAAVDGAARARAGGASACELLDRTFLDVAALAPGSPTLPDDTEAVLLIEVEGENAPAAAALARQVGAESGAAGAGMVMLGLDPATEMRLWALRHAASPILARLDPALKSMQFIEDGCVPPGRLPAYVHGVRAALAGH